MMQEEIKNKRYERVVILVNLFYSLLSSPPPPSFLSSHSSSPSRTITWITFISIPIVMAFYILVSISFFAVLSYDQIRSTEAIGLVS